MIKVFRNGQPVNIFCSTFNGGEEQVSLQKPLIVSKEAVNIEVILDNSSEVMRFLMVVDAVKRLYRPAHLSLKMSYVPYARQDRVCNVGEALSIKVFCELINSMSFDKVVISNPHSDVTPALLNNCVISSRWEDSLAVIINTLNDENVVLVSPDAGALKKTYAINKLIQNDSDVIIATKERNTTDGSITNTQFSGDVTGKTCVICDDIIDGGYTFIQLAKALKEAGAVKVILAVTHGIFSKGLEVLSPFIDVVISSNSFKSEQVFDEYRKSGNNQIKTFLVNI